MWIELRDIHKYFGSIRANEGINLRIAPGAIHGILGENGAGKSTLMKILSGYSQKTKGAILLSGKTVSYQNPAQAVQLGIGMLYQDPLDFPRLTVLDNFMLGQTAGLIDQQKICRLKFERLSTTFNFCLDPDTNVRGLTLGERQQLEIMRLLALGVEVLILDEPTTGISSTQKEMLFKALNKLATDGKIVILVSHKLEDVEALCHSVTVLRHGRVTGRMDAPFDTSQLLKMMFGTPPLQPARTRIPPGDTVLTLRQVSAAGERTGLKRCSVAVRRGEIVGLAGLEGSGQGVFLRIASGLNRPQSGSVVINGRKVSGRDYHATKKRGVAFLPTSRLEEGLISGLNILEHFALQNTHNNFWVRWQNALQVSARQIENFRIKGSPDSPVESLSGGNQQRLLLSFLPTDPALLLLENPTRGLDVESVHWVWQHLQKYTASESGTSIVFSSSELDEIMMIADRVLVFFNGSIIKDALIEETDIEELGRAIAGKV